MKKTVSESLEKLRKLRGTLLAREKEKAGHVLRAAAPAPAKPKPEPVAEPDPKPFAVKAAEPRAARAAKGAAGSVGGLPPESVRKLDHHSEGNVWTHAGIVERLVHDALHGAYAGISYRGVTLATHGLYRSFDRRSHRPGLRLISDQGEFFINVRPSHGGYERWLSLYQARQAERPHEEACVMCAFELQQLLESYEQPGQTHLIYPEDFLVEQLA